MMYFGNRRPRGFHYTRRFGSEQRDILDSLRRGATPEEVARRSLDGDYGAADGSMRGSRARRGAAGRGIFVYAGCLVAAALVVLAAMLAALLAW